jgi:hypothetical protein
LLSSLNSLMNRSATAPREGSRASTRARSTRYLPRLASPQVRGFGSSARAGSAATFAQSASQPRASKIKCPQQLIDQLSSRHSPHRTPRSLAPARGACNPDRPQ